MSLNLFRLRAMDMVLSADTSCKELAAKLSAAVEALAAFAPLLREATNAAAAASRCHEQASLAQVACA